MWLAVGLLAGCGLLDDDLVVFLMAALIAGIAIAGPRRTFRSPWLWLGGIIAAGMWAPYLVWQARHGWPELTVSRGIANGASGSSTSRPLFVLEQLVIVSVFLVPVWLAGLVRLFRAPEVRFARSIGWAYLLLLAVFLIAGGKVYYPAGLYPVLLAAGAQPTLIWLRRGRERLRRVALALALLLSALVSAAIALPVTPIHDLHTRGLAYDVGDTVAWPTYVREIATAWKRLPASCRDPDQQLRRGWRHRPLWPGARTTYRLQRPHGLLVLGTAATERDLGARRRLRSRVPRALPLTRATAQAARQPPPGQQRRAARAPVVCHGTTRKLEARVAAVQEPRLKRTAAGSSNQTSNAAAPRRSASRHAHMAAGAISRHGAIAVCVSFAPISRGERLAALVRIVTCVGALDLRGRRVGADHHRGLGAEAHAVHAPRPADRSRACRHPHQAQGELPPMHSFLVRSPVELCSPANASTRSRFSRRCATLYTDG